MRAQTAEPDTYKYDHVRSQTLMSDMSFRPTAPRPGDRLPDFALLTTDGTRLSSETLLGAKPLLLVPGSLTCPMTKASAPMLKRLHAEFGERVQMVLLHVREAHPGEHREQPHSFEEKMEHAKQLQAREAFPFPVLVDDDDGSVHRSLDEKPNSAWLADARGIIIYRALWAGDESGLRQALEAAVRGEKPAKPESTRRLAPMAEGIGVMQETLREAGPRAQRDLIKAAPPMAAMAWIADRFRPLSPRTRGYAAMGTLAALTAGAVAATVRAIRH
ncbi:redoxin family protein [Allopontixanthobacter sp.]|uniref:redoxin family protein n=1 Tax=Allopontixanthobacter sp. TaxID=2906452 RepID=UPI002ABA53D5|nr:redoxin family protein [Allopontixanthobacter sp.]MDZ4307713.1 redoxin domain-containing protein [Allopontixanthobacter sp.]